MLQISANDPRLHPTSKIASEERRQNRRRFYTKIQAMLTLRMHLHRSWQPDKSMRHDFAQDVAAVAQPTSGSRARPATRTITHMHAHSTRARDQAHALPNGQ